MKRHLVVGDVHGCFDELRRLIDRAKLSTGAEITLVGDLVNKGPDSIGVVRFCRENGIGAVMGNHDDYLVRCIAARRRGDDKEFSEGVRKIAKKIADEDAAWLKALPLWERIPGQRAVVVHAGLIPGRALTDQKRDNLLTMRSVRPDGTGSKRVDEGVPWASLYRGPSHVYFGHDAVRGLQRWKYATGLDTGCVYGGRLTAFDLSTESFVSVIAKKAYAEAGKAVQRAAERPLPRAAGRR
jgi:diadenosine tetraphosphatase ApaH/serine/threonine PP2A family protein phosphatase